MQRTTEKINNEGNVQGANVHRQTHSRGRRAMLKGTVFVGLSLGILSSCMPIQPVPPQSAPAQITPTRATGAEKPTLQIAPSQGITQENQMQLNLPANPIVVEAMKDLGRRLNLSLEQIGVVSSEDVSWPDSGLGCPQPGMVYTQVMVDGMRIVLSANDKTYTYHSGGRRGVFLCENPQ